MDLRLELHQARQARLAKWAAAALPAHKPAQVETKPNPIQVFSPAQVAALLAIKIKTPRPLPPQASPKEIADMICRETLDGSGYTLADVMGPRRDNGLMAVRWKCIVAISENYPQWSTIQIGDYFGRDHATILHALKKSGAWPRGSYWEAVKHGQMSLFSQGAGK
jgi:hypothetical protein